MTTSQRNEQRGRLASLAWQMHGNGWGLILVVTLLAALLLLWFGLILTSAADNPPVMAQYTPNSDILERPSVDLSSPLPQTFAYPLSPALAPVISHQKKPGDL
jgi:hypothetical protein